MTVYCDVGKQLGICYNRKECSNKKACSLYAYFADVDNITYKKILDDNKHNIRMVLNGAYCRICGDE